MQPHPTVTKMADTMRERAAAQGHCSEPDLHAAGFDAQDIKEHSQAAAKLAATKARKQLHPSRFLQKKGA